MIKLTPRVIKNFSDEEKILYRAGFMNEDKKWSGDAEEYAVEFFLDAHKKELVKMGKEIIKEEEKYIPFSMKKDEDD